jgi:hypothetical protein
MKLIVRNKKRLTSDSTMSKIITRVRYAQHIVINHDETVNDQHYDYED